LSRNRLASIAVALALAAGTLPAPPASAQIVSRSYVFKSGVILEMALPTDAGLRLDSVYFEMPPKTSGRLTAADRPVTAVVAVSNTSEEARKAGLALALYDDDGRLLAVASGGSKLGWVKPGRQQSFSLVFGGAYSEAHLATTFQVTLESK
jgi:hypothetical protein